MKKKGSALLTTLIVVLMLTVLATSVMSVSLSSYISVIKVETSDQLKFAAESGVEKEIAKLKTNPSQGDESYSYTINGISCNLKYTKTKAYDGTNPDLAGKTMGLIETTAAKNGKTKSSRVFLSLTTTSSLEQYYQRMTGYCLVVDDDMNSSNESVVTSDADYVPVITGGTSVNGRPAGGIYIQGGNVNLKPGFLNIQGDLMVNAKQLTLGSYQHAYIGSFIYVGIPFSTYNLYNTGSLGKSMIQSGNIYIKADSYSVDNNIHVSNSDTGNKPVLAKNVLKSNSDNVILPMLSLSSGRDVSPYRPDSRDNTFVVYKPSLPAGQSAFDFNTLAFTFKNFINVSEENYKGYYKVLVVDGDLIIENPYPSYNPYLKAYGYYKSINYIVYCTGKVTFRGQVEFNNSAIFAKRVQFDNESYGHPYAYNIFGFFYDHYKTSVKITGTDQSLWSPYHDKILSYLGTALTGYTTLGAVDIKEWIES